MKKLFVRQPRCSKPLIKTATIIRQYLFRGFVNFLWSQLIRSVRDETFKFALNVIAAAAHGVQLSWSGTGNGNQIWKNHTLSFRSAISSCLRNLLPIVFLPTWIRKLPFKRLREVDTGYREFACYMRDLVEIERSLVKYGERDTLLSNLIKNSGTGGKDDKIFSDDEIIGNTFIFLVVGHESTYLPGL